MAQLMKLRPTAKSHIAVKAIVFDMDGTLSIPQPWMFGAMREAIGLTDPKMDILTFVDQLPSKQLKDDANEQLKAVEARAMAEMQPQPGLLPLLEYLTAHEISTSICTRNLIKPVRHLIASFVPDEHQRFAHILTRDFRPTKPDPAPLLHISEQLGIAPENMVMVGDSYDDVECGAAAGAGTILVRSATNGGLLESRADLIDASVHDLSEIIELLERGFEKKR
ncbi:putative haloacid dehalogenase-like hydrolase [Lachancea thermotolerans CBS 6340]|uniref:KLTH0F15224p n=1 Tax=Lachancea thermotolerans (strain ATCC 56472 / CBS 6340 / NRRL Y-8284) TaxID=559295 RepID=C5DJC2_LACTC|nr:KLTH0F15224p [Lachancea thermotolerans CBS 6340]CAR24411.1 KLTH0F15224p [Lachancea thermotolerans CBS 6340]